MQNHILSIILFTPLVGALVLLFVPKENKDVIRWIANFFALAGFLISLALVPMFWALRFDATHQFKFLEGSTKILPFRPRLLLSMVTSDSRNDNPKINAALAPTESK